MFNLLRLHHLVVGRRFTERGVPPYTELRSRWLADLDTTGCIIYLAINIDHSCIIEPPARTTTLKFSSNIKNDGFTTINYSGRDETRQYDARVTIFFTVRCKRCPRSRSLDPKLVYPFGSNKSAQVLTARRCAFQILD